MNTKDLIGRTITGIRYQTDEEMDDHLWDRPAIVIEVDHAIKLYPSRDEEGNGPGELFGDEPAGGPFLLYLTVEESK